MDKSDFKELIGKKVKIVLTNDYYYKCIILSVGDDYVKIRDIYDTTTYIVLKEIKVLEVKE